jgi:hypothetical protein
MISPCFCRDEEWAREPAGRFKTGKIVKMKMRCEANDFSCASTDVLENVLLYFILLKLRESPGNLMK